MTDVTLRPAGQLEKYFIIRNAVKCYNNVQCSATYTIPRSLLQSSDSHGLANAIYSALEQLFKTQPFLGVTVENESGPEPKWKRLKTLDLQEVVTLTTLPDSDPSDSSQNLEIHIKSVHREPVIVVNTLPLWRVYIFTTESELGNIESSTLSFTLSYSSHHGIGDGLSVSAFHLIFLESLNWLIANSNTLTTSPIINIPFLPLLPTLEESMPLPITFFNAIFQIFKAFIYNPIDPKEWTGSLISRTTFHPPLPNHRFFFLSSSLVTQLVKKCRSEKTTITALLTILVARHISDTHPTYTHFPAKVPGSLRKFTGNARTDMGNFVSSLNLYFSSEPNPPRGYIPCRSPSSSLNHNEKPDANDETLWSSAREVKESLTKQTASPTDFDVGLLKFVGDFKGFFWGNYGRKREGAFEVSNAGVLDGGLGGSESREEGRATFDRPIFSTAMCTYGVPFLVTVATVKGGSMNVCVGWETGVVSDEDGRELAAWLERALVGLVD